MRKGFKRSQLTNQTHKPIQVVVNPTPVVVNAPESTCKRDWFDISMLVLNILVAGVTLFLFNETKEANRISRASMDSANVALGVAKKANEISEANYKLALAISKSDDSISIINLELNRKSVEAQIKSLKETQKQFEIINKPYIEFRDFRWTKFEPDEKFQIAYTIVNLSNATLKITKRRLFLYSNGHPIELKNVKNYNDKRTNETRISYFNKENQISENFISQADIPKAMFDIVVHQMGIKFYFAGEIEYENEATKKRRLYKFYIEKFLPPSTSYSIIYNENIDLN